MTPIEPDAGRPASIWKRKPEPAALNAFIRGTMDAVLGIEYVEVGPDYLRATMPVDENTTQPLGLLHGGASVALAESLGSVASYLCLEGEDRIGVGQSINASHIRSVRAGGRVTGTARPLHLGRTSHVWQIEIRDPEHRLVSVGRLTVAVIERR